jgi:hypothetical protein
MGMTNKRSVEPQLSEQEIRLVELLRQHPEMRDRFESILNLASSTDGPLKTADEVEALLIEEVRRLGHATMTQWAVGAEERVSQETKEQEPEVLSRKKKR